MTVTRIGDFLNKRRKNPPQKIKQDEFDKGVLKSQMVSSIDKFLPTSEIEDAFLLFCFNLAQAYITIVAVTAFMK